MMFEEWTTCSGIEIPKTTWKQTRKYLRKFAKTGILFFDTDDGPGLIVRKQLMEICSAVGINCSELGGNQIVIWDGIKFPFVDGSKCDSEG